MKHETSYKNCHQRTSSIQQHYINKQSDTCSLNKIQDQKMTTLLDLSTRIVEHPALKFAFQNESRVRNHRILSVSLPEHSRIEIKTVTFSDRKQ